MLLCELTGQRSRCCVCPLVLQCFDLRDVQEAVIAGMSHRTEKVKCETMQW